jgi:hypothetical protein
MTKNKPQKMCDACCAKYSKKCDCGYTHIAHTFDDSTVIIATVKLKPQSDDGILDLNKLRQYSHTVIDRENKVVTQYLNNEKVASINFGEQYGSNAEASLQIVQERIIGSAMSVQYLNNKKTNEKTSK